MHLPGQFVYIETYGCQMNLNDSEIIASILKNNNYSVTDDYKKADLVLINTCSIRENAEQRIRRRLQVFTRWKKDNPSLIIGVVGCMAVRLQTNLFEEEPLIDIIAGPDTYRDLPELIHQAGFGQKAINTFLSVEETYSEINPIRLGKNQVSAFVSIMRGCNNHCAYCVVPKTRGRERSRDPGSIIREIEELLKMNYREVILLGQNVNSYQWNQNGHSLDFAALIRKIAELDKSFRIRFLTSHPKDLPDHLLETMSLYPNICRHIHLPLQSGSNRILNQMNRKYSREDYMNRIESIRKVLPDCGITTDIIAGFCSENENDHRETLELMKWVGFDFAYMFKYSERPDTMARLKYHDNVPDHIKTRRLTEIIELQSRLSRRNHENEIGNIHEVLTEGTSRKSTDWFYGRTTQNKVVVFPKKDHKCGEYVNVRITGCTPATLIGTTNSDV